MWNRADLKEKAKRALKQNYWKIVLVAIIAGVVGGGSSAGLNLDTSSFEDAFSEGFESGYESGYEYDDEYYNYEENIYEEDIYDSDYEDEFALEEEGIGTGVVANILVLWSFISVVLIIAVLVAVFVYYPLEIGTRRFFIKSLNQEAAVKEVAYGYDNGYKNVIKIIFLQRLYIALWSMLFVIPGIVKSYEYLMIPYLLAENPNMTKEEAFRLSKQMMTGNKWNAFVLDWSFFGWDILSGFTLGILSIFYVQPYKHLTYAALYEELSAINGYPARATMMAEEKEWNTPF